MVLFSIRISYPVCCGTGHVPRKPMPREVGVGASVIRVEGGAMVCILV